MTPSGSFQGWKREICVTSGRLSWMPIQLSTREGFGLVVSESLWKGTPVVAGRAGGISLQMADGAGGSLVTSVDECAAAIVALLRDPARAEELGWRGRRRVREHFLPRLLLNELRLMESLVAEPPRVGLEEWREPVCGLASVVNSGRLAPALTDRPCTSAPAPGAVPGDDRRPRDGSRGLVLEPK